jgi:hypothetical protein
MANGIAAQNAALTDLAIRCNHDPLVRPRKVGGRLCTGLWLYRAGSFDRWLAYVVVLYGWCIGGATVNALDENEWEVLAVGYQAISGKAYHASDCATSCAPAEKPSACDCDAPDAADLSDAVIDEIILEFAGGIVRVPSVHNPRGYVSYYRPREAMRKAITKATGQ